MRFRDFRRTVLASAVVWGLAGCASGPKLPKLDPAQVQQFESRGYPAPHQYATQQSEDLRVVQGVPMRLVWYRPQAAGAHPLVVFMPGAGQDAHAFSTWCQSVAEAGYVVLSWQPLPTDDHLPMADLGDHPDLHRWASERFASTQLQRRAQLLDQLMQSLNSAQASGDTAVSGVDLGRAALVGFELGAFTASTAVGEHVHGVDEAASVRGRFKAAVLISPYASFDQGAFDTRYRDMSAPVLTITSDADTDPFGLVSAPYLRTAPFGGMPSGNKYLLTLKAASHADLGARDDGSTLNADAGEGMKPQDRTASERGGGSGGGKQRPSGAGRGSGGGRGGGGPGGEGGRDGAGGGMAGMRVTPTVKAMQQSAVSAASIAFLDAHVQGDALAQTWLSHQASKWLTPIGDWQSK